MNYEASIIATIASPMRHRLLATYEPRVRGFSFLRRLNSPWLMPRSALLLELPTMTESGNSGG